MYLYYERIIIMSQVSIHHLIQLQKYVFSLVKRTFRIYFLSNFERYHTAVLTIVIMLYITGPALIYKQNLSLPPPSSFPHTSDNHKSNLFLCKFGLSFNFFFTILYIREIMTSFTLCSVPQGPSILQQIAEFLSSLWLSSVQLHA